MKATAPGKLILSGEHSVVYGAPAIAVAVDERVTATFTPHSNNQLSICTAFGETSLACDQLASLVVGLDQRYEEFLAGEILIADLLEYPAQLLFYTLAQSGFIQSGSVQIQSSIPVGAGMGSSAAVIAALLRLTRQNNLQLEAFCQQVQYCERLQHGRGSIIDAAAVVYGGAVSVEQGRVRPLPLYLGGGWYRYHTGTPICSTGETVAWVRQHWAEDSALWSGFSEVTKQLANSLDDPAATLSLIRQNHSLLETIGVVPESVAALVQQIEQAGGAAKICGAGAHTGDAAGQLLVYLPEPIVAPLEQWLGIQLHPIQQAARGAERAEN